jgi:hypothetical protein
MAMCRNWFQQNQLKLFAFFSLSRAAAAVAALSRG